MFCVQIITLIYLEKAQQWNFEYINNQRTHTFNAKIIYKIIKGFNKDVIKIADIGSYPGTLSYILRKEFLANKLKISIYDHPNIINENHIF